MTEPPLSPYASPARPSDILAQDADAARERAIRILTDAYAYDVITDYEFERRLGHLGLTATTAMIEAAVADLPVAGTLVRQAHPGLMAREPSEGRIVGFMGETRRKGPWRVPRHLEIRAFMSDIKIDLRYAAIPAGCSIDVMAFMANVSLIAPPGLIVDFNVDTIMASAGSEADAARLPGNSAAHVQVRGTAIMAELRVRVRALSR